MWSCSSLAWFLKQTRARTLDVEKVRTKARAVTQHGAELGSNKMALAAVKEEGEAATQESEGVYEPEKLAAIHQLGVDPVSLARSHVMVEWACSSSSTVHQQHLAALTALRYISVYCSATVACLLRQQTASTLTEKCCFECSVCCGSALRALCWCAVGWCRPMSGSCCWSMTSCALSHCRGAGLHHLMPASGNGEQCVKSAAKLTSCGAAAGCCLAQHLT